MKRIATKAMLFLAAAAMFFSFFATVFPEKVQAEDSAYELNIKTKIKDSDPAVYITGATYTLKQVRGALKATGGYEDVLPEFANVEFKVDPATNITFTNPLYSIKFVAAGASGYVQLKLPEGKYELREKSPAPGYLPWDIPDVQNPDKDEFITFSLPHSNEQGTGYEVLTIEPKAIKILGNVKLTKIRWEDDAPLAGVEFSLFQKDNSGAYQPFNVTDPQTGNASNVWTTDNAGKIEVKNMPVGDYRFEETKAATGYILANKAVMFSIAAANSGKTQKFTAHNTKKSQIKLLIGEKDASQGPFIFQRELPFDVTFRAVDYPNFKENNIKKYRWRGTFDQGFTMIPQTDADVYIKKGNDILAKLKLNGPEVNGYSLKVFDTSTGKFEVYWQNSALGNSEVVPADRTPQNIDVVIKAKIDANVSADSLLNSNCKLSSAYIKLRETRSDDFDDDDDGNIEVGTNKVTLEITKKDADNPNTLLKGAKFELIPLDSNGNENRTSPCFREGTTGVDGKLKFEKLEFGLYHLKETKAPTDYNLPVAVKEIELKKPADDPATPNDESTILNATVDIFNVKRGNVPFTGTTGQVLFIVGGVAAIALFAFLIIRRKKADAKTDANSSK